MDHDYHVQCWHVRQEAIQYFYEKCKYKCPALRQAWFAGVAAAFEGDLK